MNSSIFLIQFMKYVYKRTIKSIDPGGESI